tara:strand:+ start:2761 stop:3141 length:381 start_codon:yes stop_codon:yes gene_type:complete
MSNPSKLPKNYSWWTERERIALVEYGKDIDCAVSPSSVSAGLKVRILVNRRALDFGSDLTSVSELPPQFHEALAYKAIAMGYTRGERTNIQMAQYYEMLYRQAVKEGKKYARRRHLGTGFIKQVDF